jgi:hypothetical protein
MGKNYYPKTLEEDIKKAISEKGVLKLRNQLDYIHKEYQNGIENN